MSQNTIYARALYDFAGDGNNLLPLQEGELVLVTEQRDDGWWGGVANGRSGFFPANYVEITQNPEQGGTGAAGAGALGGAGGSTLGQQETGYQGRSSGIGAGTAAAAGVGAGALGAAAYGRQSTGVGAIHAGDQVFTGKDEYEIEEEKWYLREKRPRALCCGLVLSKWQYRVFFLNALTLFQAAFITITILVIAPALIKFLVAHSILRFDALTITNPDSVNNQFVMRASATLSNAGPFNANVNPSTLKTISQRSKSRTLRCR